MSARGAASVGVSLTTEERESFERDGYLVLPRVLTRAEAERYERLVDGVFERRRRNVGAPVAVHELSAVRACPDLAPLCDHPRVLGAVWSILGWNVHVYHSHIDVHPPTGADVLPRFEWHQDGGRQNRDLEAEPRPRMSIKVAYWLSDLSLPGRGNLRLVPGSHRVNRIDGPPKRDMPWPDPAGALDVTAEAGDALLFDRRVWHARSPNRSTTTRKAVFFAYTYRWVVPRDVAARPDARHSPVQRQLLGLLDDVDGDNSWGHEPGRVPLYELLARAGLLEVVGG
jgi:ectoine hydroxylase-related dioxygenase (phytanoyl-CoA dioxygenase family)